ncbi:type III restriction enzyme [Chryseobacterium taichungense]|uniref:Type III restriction enzyme n=1 Tax=Chryseobacterium taichungense TaxID=295069 RepID=A0A1H7W9P7_9FLAO|nr:DEAD/DEAH box helicase family protein [Chryseobacterium taichungense]SEM18233.1 type III restriction enzyme [Chryseobacterium taichungense]
MKIQFEGNLSYQQDAIEAVVDVFKGQEKLQSNFTVLAPKDQTIDYEADLGYANKINLLPKQIVENVQAIQMKNGLRISDPNKIDRNDLQFSIEMETGTGKTYVFTRSIMEMNRKYGFKKFIIVVPSVSIREGINKSLELTDDHFKKVFENTPYKYFIYDSSNLSQVRDFATSDQIRIMVINVQAFSQDVDTAKGSKRIMLEYNDKLGAKPISLLQDTNPIVIVDEPQSTMSSKLQIQSIKNLNPIAIYRFSATHKDKVNLLYKFDAIDAYNDGKVKKIEVASVTTKDEVSDGAFIQVLSISNKNGFKVKLNLDIKGKNGKVTRSPKEVKLGDDLYQITKLDQYYGFNVSEISTDPEFIEFSNGQFLQSGQTLGGVNDTDIKRKLIAKTIQEHLDKEVKLNPKGIKVLSLFFIDKVARYRGYDEEGNILNGEYAQIFEEEYNRIIQSPKYKLSLFKEVQDLEVNVSDVHKGYFSTDKRSKKSNSKDKFEAFKDTSGSVKADEDTYHLIMTEKEKLLSFDSPVRFIFSHTALREGWDNPNVFQICLLKEMGASEIKRRQEIGRGLRISVDQTGNRVYDENVNILTTVVNESFKDFVEGYQKELTEDTGITFGHLAIESFNTVVASVDENDELVYLGQEASSQIYQTFIELGYIDKKGKIQDSLKIHLKEGTIDLGQEFSETVSKQIYNILKQVAGSLEIKDNNNKREIKINKEVFLSEDFKKLWDTIKYKTVYQVEFDSEKLIENCIKTINNNVLNQQAKIEFVKGRLAVGKGGIETDGELKTYVENLEVKVRNLPDIITYLQNETDLTRKTIVLILKGLEARVLKYFKTNPQAFIEKCIDVINIQKRLFIVDGIKYQKIGDHDYYEQKELEETDAIGYLSKYMVEASKSVFDYTLCDSDVELNLAREFEGSENVSLYTKLPGWFKIATPLGNYNPDWAILYNNGDGEKLYFVTESKGTIFDQGLKPIENGKIKCGKEHFKAIGSRMIVAHTMDDVYNQV